MVRRTKKTQREEIAEKMSELLNRGYSNEGIFYEIIDLLVKYIDDEGISTIWFTEDFG